mmetsp:Transcript_14560/g.25409  ORF Transcript_14560/g.25409 Transcript_14560/m.25409 type:complete len:208 (+) Transcript_14560:70-693(+)
MADKDDELSLPKATIVKLIKEYLPSDVRLASETSDMLVACCTEFVQSLSSESNDVAMREKKQIIQPEHVLRALEDLGFSAFVSTVAEVAEQCKADAKVSQNQRSALRKTGAEEEGLTEAEQIALQQQMFADARAASLTSAGTAAAMAASYEGHLAVAAQQASAGPSALNLPSVTPVHLQAAQPVLPLARAILSSPEVPFVEPMEIQE